MLKLTFTFALLLGTMLSPKLMHGSNSINASSGVTSEMQTCAVDASNVQLSHCISPQVLHKVILAALEVWTNETYGALRSAYNHGHLDDWYSVEHSTPNVPAYYVYYDGNEICVTINI